MLELGLIIGAPSLVLWACNSHFRATKLQGKTSLPANVKLVAGIILICAVIRGFGPSTKADYIELPQTMECMIFTEIDYQMTYYQRIADTSTGLRRLVAEKKKNDLYSMWANWGPLCFDNTTISGEK